MCGEDLDVIDCERLGVDGVRLNDSHSVVVDAEHIVRVARDRDQTETVARTQSIQYAQYSI